MKQLTPAECAYEAFGGVRETARALGLTFGTVSRWRQSRHRQLSPGSIPQHHIKLLLERAKERNIRLTLEELIFGRGPVSEGIVTVRSGIKVEIKLHDTWASMTNTLAGAGA